MRWILRLLWIIPLILVLIFALNNRQDIIFTDWQGQQISISAGYLFLLLFAAGWLTMGLTVVPAWVRGLWRMRQLRRTSARLEQEVQALKIKTHMPPANATPPPSPDRLPKT